MMKIKCIIILISLLSVTCKNGAIKTISSGAIRVRLTSVCDSVISIPVHSTGVLISSEELKLSFKTGGIVEKFYTKEGDRVKKGECLASLNLSEINAQVDQARNGYEKALRDYGRAENLYTDSVATLEQRQNAATALNMAKSAFDIAKFNLAHSQILAPDDGLILKQFVRANELVSAGFPILLFGSTGENWKVRAGFSDKDIVKINQGDSADIFFDAYNAERFQAVVNQIGEISNPLTGTYEVELVLKKTDHRLASGFVAAIDLFPSAKKSFSLVPVESLVEADGYKGYIYIVTGSMSVQKVRIDIEALIGSMAAVKGLPEGITEVVSEGAAYLKNGMKVEVIK